VPQAAKVSRFESSSEVRFLLLMACLAALQALIDAIMSHNSVFKSRARMMA
jgi:hypothetical protein